MRPEWRSQARPSARSTPPTISAPSTLCGPTVLRSTASLGTIMLSWTGIPGAHPCTRAPEHRHQCTSISLMLDEPRQFFAELLMLGKTQIGVAVGSAPAHLFNTRFDHVALRMTCETPRFRRLRPPNHQRHSALRSVVRGR